MPYSAVSSTLTSNFIDLFSPLPDLALLIQLILKLILILIRWQRRLIHRLHRAKLAF